ncbi:MAG TPA: hypothetical protein VE778_01860 [Candidatus Bathyarchaeia archaeon]|nr:hypothetical protein [Candidatus Bathyarchaeia archaeon]
MLLWNHNFAAIRREHADGGFVQFGKGDVRYAAGKKCHSRTARPRRGKCRAKAVEEKLLINLRKKAIAFRQSKQFQDANAARDGLHARTLVEAENTRSILDEMRGREKIAEKEVARDMSEPRALVTALDAGARVLDQLSVLHAGGTGGFTGATVKAFVDVIDESVADWRFRLRLAVELALENVKHLTNAATGRIRLEIPEPIRGTRVQAQAAVNAARVVLVNRRWAGDGVMCQGSPY